MYVTLIVGIVHNKKIHLGADTGLFSDDRVMPGAITKVVRQGPLVLGAAGTLSWVSTAISCCYPSYSTSVEKWIEIDIVGTIRSRLQIRGVEPEGELLIGVNGALWYADSDGGVHSYETYSYAAIGVAAPFAIGSLHETDKTRLSPKIRLKRALECACLYSCSVVEPFCYVSV